VTAEARVALIGNADGPFGRAVAVALAEAGVDVALATLSTDDAGVFAVNSIANELWALGRRHLTLSLDRSRPDPAAELVTKTLSELGGLDLLVTLPEPARVAASPLAEGARNDPEQSFGDQLGDLLTLCREAGAVMVQHGGGGILNAVQTGAAAGVVTELTETGVAGLTRALARGWSGRVAVNAAVIREQTEPAALGSLAALLASSLRSGTLVSGQVFEL
jgi:NAD(P)-dependent dehydrogenase (short-subunit alcohol dehydrogenase family)